PGPMKVMAVPSSLSAAQLLPRRKLVAGAWSNQQFRTGLLLLLAGEGRGLPQFCRTGRQADAGGRRAPMAASIFAATAVRQTSDWMRMAMNASTSPSSRVWEA